MDVKNVYIVYLDDGSQCCLVNVEGDWEYVSGQTVNSTRVIFHQSQIESMERVDAES